jgi:copper ion binding protein
MALTVAAADTLTVRINGMRCSECGHKVKNVLRKSPAIGALDFNYERRTVKIAYDAQQTCTDSIYSMLERTGRYKAKPYDPTEVIRRGYGQRIADMHCQKCYNRISERLSKLEGIDSLAPHLDNQYIFIRYDANRTDRAAIRELVNKLGYTPVNYYSSPKVEYGYYLLPAEQATQETLETVLALDGVEDVNVNAKRKSLAVTFFNDETTADKLLQEILAAGIKAELPKPHECDEKERDKR